MPTPKVKSSNRRRCANACETCKRRKERCDSIQPCGRCVRRGVGTECIFAARSSPSLRRTKRDRDSHDHRELHPDADRLPDLAPLGAVSADPSGIAGPSPGSSRAVPVPQLSRLIRDGRGELVFVGDAANLSFLQIIRRLASDSLGFCPFSDDALQHVLVETTPSGVPDWIVDMAKRPPSKPDPAEAKYLLQWYGLATNGVFNMFNDRELQGNLSTWLQAGPDSPEQDPRSAVFFLVLAIGAQTCPQTRDDLAERYFNYGRYLTVAGDMESPCILAVQTHALITMYLLGASRRNAAFMYLGTAVRAAYALGLHRRNVNVLFDQPEYVLRERLWKGLRVLDLFMSASLGRPPSTCETRDTKTDVGYSAINDICSIFEAILTQVYAKQMVSMEALEQISQHHRQWATKFTSGLVIDDIQPSEFLDNDKGEKSPNIGLCHLKEAYYWAIMLVARPFLIESASKNVSSTPPLSPPHQILAHACVDSAIRTVDLLHGLTTSEKVPKRLPFVVNSLFVAALVLGLAQFSDLDGFFQLEKSLARSESILCRLSQHDAVAQRNLAIVRHLQAACDSYREKRARQRMERQSLFVGKFFGTIHGTVWQGERPVPAVDKGGSMGYDTQS
ncbi:hypothetical protein QQZ08_003038 [Neonectria magnoliae]|uniref:Zn(2)-C6 fungal-type domain-containing protein n=1 Tax=Neonectria magnoliae TaxID=2732573 RepID=A0ABR1IC09_9HYPO